MLEKRGRKAAQRALRELTSNSDHNRNNDTSHVSSATADTTVNTTGGGGGKRRATHHPWDSHTRVPRRTPLGGVSGNDNTVDSSRLAGVGAGRAAGIDLGSSRTDAAGWRAGCDGRGGGGGGGEEEDDAVWLKEAEALLSRGNQDLGVGL